MLADRYAIVFTVATLAIAGAGLGLDAGSDPHGGGAGGGNALPADPRRAGRHRCGPVTR